MDYRSPTGESKKVVSIFLALLYVMILGGGIGAVGLLIKMGAGQFDLKNPSTDNSFRQYVEDTYENQLFLSPQVTMLR